MNIPKFKPTLKSPSGEQSEEFQDNFKKEMIKNAPDIKLNEVDELLNEKEQTLKKKIFDLSKMEALVFSDPKLTAVYDKMAEDGEEKYGYHYNETIMNIIFNDYILNSPKYLQKYKMAIPKKKKRRDKSGIEQLRKIGKEKIEKSNVSEGDESLITKVMFLVHPDDPDVFAYFPEENHDVAGKYKMGYSHIGQHSAVNPNYARESRPATPEEYSDLKAELENQVGYNLDIINSTNVDGDVEETTSAGSAGGAAGYVGYSQPLGYEKEKKEVDESSDSSGSGAYSITKVWGGGDLMKGGQSNPMLRKPIWKGGSVIAESNYLTDPSGFEEYVNELNEQESTGKISTLEELKALGRKLKKEDIPNLAGEALYKIAKSIAGQFLPFGWDDLPDINSLWDYIDENGGMTYEELTQAVKEGVNDRLSEEGMSLDDLMEGKLDEKAKSKKQQRFMGMVRGVQKGELSPDEVGDDVSKAAETMKNKDVKDFAKTKHNKLPEKVKSKKKVNEHLSLHDIVEYESEREGEDPFEMQGIKWQFVNAKYPDGKIDIGVYRFGHDLVYDYSRWREEFNINETDQSLIDANSMTMANKPSPVGDLGGNVEMGARAMGESKVFIKNDSVMNENKKLFEELDNELNAFSIHHNKLKKMNEDKKTLSLINRDRLAGENEKNFKSDMKQSRTKEIIDVEKELQWKDQQTDVGKDPQKLGQDIEKKEIKSTNAEGDEHLKNVSDSTNNKGDEIPKRNLRTKEQKEVDMYRLGQQDLVYDNEPSERFEDRMKADMGDELYKQREEKLKFRGKAPMYNKDPQPVEDTTSDKVQFNKEQDTWNKRVGIGESIVSGKYSDILGKTKFVDFNFGNVSETKKISEAHIPINLKGMGNVYSSKVALNENISKVINEWDFYLFEGNIVAHKPVQNLTESEHKENKQPINEQFNKFKHLSGYKPSTFVNTKNVKKNRGF